MGPMGHFGLSPGHHDMASMGMVRHGLSPGRHGLSSPGRHGLSPSHHPAGLSPVHHHQHHHHVGGEISRHNSIDEPKSPLAPTLIMQVGFCSK